MSRPAPADPREEQAWPEHYTIRVELDADKQRGGVAYALSKLEARHAADPAILAEQIAEALTGRAKEVLRQLILERLAQDGIE